MTIAVAAKARAPLSQSELADRLGVEGATMVAPSTPRRSASSDCDSGARALAATAMVIQLAWLTPKYLSLRSKAWRQALDALCSALLKRSSRSVIRRALIVSNLTNISHSETAKTIAI